MRYADTCTLVTDTERYIQTEDGDIIPAESKTTSKEVFCNCFSVSMNTWANAHAQGLKADLSMQIRACEYENEHEVIYAKSHYEVERVVYKGDFVVLYLAKSLSSHEPMRPIYTGDADG